MIDRHTSNHDEAGYQPMPIVSHHNEKGSSASPPYWQAGLQAHRGQLIVLLAVLATGVIGLSLVCSSSPPSSASSGAAASYSYIKTISTTWQSLIGSGYVDDDRPDFYVQPGMLAINRSEAISPSRRARWLPLSELDDLEARNLTGLEGDLKYADGFSLLEEYFGVLEQPEGGPVPNADEAEEDGAGTGVAADGLDYLSDKTVLLFGDSQDRFTIDFLCDLMQGTLSYREFFTSSAPQHTLTRPGRQSDWRNALHHCQLPEMLGNTTIWSFMTYGSISKNDTFRKMRPNQGPDELTERIELAGQAFRENNITIDMMIFHTM